jgi:hypothetical protein
LDEEISESDDSIQLLTFDATATRFLGKLYEDFPQSDGYHKGKCDTEGCKGLAIDEHWH